MHAKISSTYHYNEAIRTLNNAWWADKFLMIISIGWLIYKSVNFLDLAARPLELFVKANIVFEILLPSFPSPYLFYAAVATAITFCIILVIKPDLFLLRLILALLLIWINIPQWCYGKISHVSNVLLLAHLFSIFIPFKNKTNADNAIAINKLFTYLYAGIFFTYSLSGLWKVLGIGYKIIFKSGEIHWLHPQASLYNAVVSHRNYDLNLGSYEYIFRLYPLWIIGFIFILYVQVTCIVAAYRKPLLAWTGFFLIVFHMINTISFLIAFYTAPLVLMALFFPYHIFFKPENIIVTENTFSGKKLKAVYKRRYANEDEDIYYGYLAYRERKYDTKNFISGLYFMPGLKSVFTIIWNIETKIKGNEN
ncbi:MAG: hypothetical protein K2X86_00270 [Cytophagaceae bacterium]|nr:hypothetical protein [Cytophagaceae bacterium]